MDDPAADEYIVKDITAEKSAWRWTNARPELKLRVTDASRLTFVMEFFIVGATFKETGPVTVTAYVNEKPIGKMLCPKPGQYRLAKPVPAGLVQPNSTVSVSAEADKLWTSKEDGVRLGFLLGAIGFPEQP